MHIVKEVRVTAPETPTRLLNFCDGLFDSLPTKSSLKKAFKRNEIFVNHAPASSGYWIKDGDTVQLMDLELQPPKPYNLPLNILYEDDFLAAIEKPAGLPVSGNSYRTLQNAVAGLLKLSSQPDALPWPKPAHRLDVPTSGIVLVAKTAGARVKLGELFEKKTISKTYHAIVVGTAPDYQKIKLPVNGKAACSEVFTEKVFPALRTTAMSLVRLHPITGRTHQLRIHLEAIGHPIVGDTLYGEDVGIRHKGLFLAATAVSFQHPMTELPLEIHCQVPHKFHSLMHRETRRWNAYQTERPASSETGL